MRDRGRHWWREVASVSEGADVATTRIPPKEAAAMVSKRQAGVEPLREFLSTCLHLPGPSTSSVSRYGAAAAGDVPVVQADAVARADPMGQLAQVSYVLKIARAHGAAPCSGC